MVSKDGDDLQPLAGCRSAAARPRSAARVRGSAPGSAHAWRSVAGRLVGCEVLQHRQRERGGLAGARFGDAEQIAAGEQRGDGGRLDRRGLEETRLLEGAQQGLGEAE